MANTVTVGDGQRFVTMSVIASDWDWRTTFPDYVNGIRVRSLQYVPSAPTDVFIMRDALASTNVTFGPEVFYVASPESFPTRYYHGRRIKLMLDVSECTIASPLNAKVIMSLGGFEE